MTDIVAWSATALLVVTFGWSGGFKVIRLPKWRDALRTYELPPAIESLALGGVPVAELAVVGLIVFGRARIAGALALAMLGLFCFALLRAHELRGDRLPCGCFGSKRERDYRLLIARNAVLALPAGAMALLGASDISRGWPEEVLPALLVVAGTMIAAWTGLASIDALRSGRPTGGKG